MFHTSKLSDFKDFTQLAISLSRYRQNWCSSQVPVQLQNLLLPLETSVAGSQPGNAYFTKNLDSKIVKERKKMVIFKQFFEIFGYYLVFGIGIEKHSKSNFLIAIKIYKYFIRQLLYIILSFVTNTKQYLDNQSKLFPVVNRTEVHFYAMKKLLFL